MSKQNGAVEARWAHNPEVKGSKPFSAIYSSDGVVGYHVCFTRIRSPVRTRIRTIILDSVV